LPTPSWGTTPDVGTVAAGGDQRRISRISIDENNLVNVIGDLLEHPRNVAGLKPGRGSTSVRGGKIRHGLTPICLTTTVSSATRKADRPNGESSCRISFRKPVHSR
jgi:hypothetical protein